MHRVLKKGGYAWFYTDGFGGIRDILADMSQTILKDVNIDYKLNKIRDLNLQVIQKPIICQITQMQNISIMILKKYTNYWMNRIYKFYSIKWWNKY